MDVPLIKDSRLHLFSIKDPLYGNDEMDYYNNNGYSVVETSFKIVAEWCCNAKVVDVTVTEIDSDGEAGDTDEASCTRAKRDPITGQYAASGLMGIPLRFFDGRYIGLNSSSLGGETSLRINLFTAPIPYGYLAEILRGELSFICVAEKWYHVYDDSGTEFRNRDVTTTLDINKLTKVIDDTNDFFGEGGTTTYTYEIAETFY